MRLGLIGLGRIGSFHADTLSRLPDVDSLVVTDAVPAAIGATVDRIGAESCASPQQLLTAGVDGVVIAASTDAHAELVTMCVAAGVPVFCEKPLARTADDAVAVQRLVNASAVPVQIGFPRRFDPAFLAARTAVRDGALGRVHTVRSTTLDPAPPSLDYLATSGGLFHDCSVHDFDAVRWVTGREVVEVYATGTAEGEDAIAALGDVHTASTVLTMDDGATAVVSNSRYNGRGYDVRLEVHGAADSVCAGWTEHTPLRNVEPGASFPGARPYDFFVDRLAAAFRASLAGFVDVVAGRRESPCTVDDALAVTWIAEAATRSLRQHRPVPLTEFI